MRDNLEQEYKRTITTIVWMGYILLCFHYYTVGHPWLLTLNMPLQGVDKFIVRFNQSSHLLSNEWLLKGVVLLLVCMRERADKNSLSRLLEIAVVRKWLALLVLGSMLFWGSGWIGYSLGSAEQLLLYSSLTTTGLLLIKQSIVHLIPLLGYEEGPEDDPSSDWRGGSHRPRGPKRPKPGKFRQVKRVEKMYA